MKRILIFCGVFLFLLYVGSCNKNQDELQPLQLSEKTFRNVSYGDFSEQKADVFLPQNRTESTAVIILVHGGGWLGGDKTDLEPFINFFLEEGYAVININYRLATSNANKFPSQIEDIAKAIQYIKEQAGSFVVSETTFGLVGHSAGAHLSLLYAYDYNSDKSVKVVAALAAPTDLADPYFLGNDLIRATFENFLGKTFQEDPALWVDASPINKLTFATAVPTILFHGGKDDLVPKAQSTKLRDQLQQLGVPNLYVEYPNEGHTWGEPALNDTKQKTADWFELYLK